MAEKITLRQATLQLLDKTEVQPNSDALALLRMLLLTQRRTVILLDEIAQRLERAELNYLGELQA